MIENSKKPIPVLVSGALGRMGSEVVNTVLNSRECELVAAIDINENCLLYTSPSPRDRQKSRMPSSA